MILFRPADLTLGFEENICLVVVMIDSFQIGGGDDRLGFEEDLSLLETLREFLWGFDIGRWGYVKGLHLSSSLFDLIIHHQHQPVNHSGTNLNGGYFWSFFLYFSVDYVCILIFYPFFPDLILISSSTIKTNHHHHHSAPDFINLVCFYFFKFLHFNLLFTYLIVVNFSDSYFFLKF